MALLAITVLLTACHALAASEPYLRVAPALLATLAVSLAWGHAWCRLLALGDNHGIDTLHALVLGMAVVASLLMFLGLTSPFGIVGNFFIVAALGAGIQLLGRRFPADSQKPGRLHLSSSAGLALAVVLFAAVAWSGENLRGIKLATPDLYQSHPWQDMFFHAKNVARFMHSQGAADLGNEQLLGLPLEPYHYGSYFLPAFVGAVSGADAYSLATSLLPVLGMVWVGLAVYVLGKTCAQGEAGAIAACGLLLVPDPSFWGFGSGWNGFFFFQQVGVGGLFGVAVLGLATSHGLRAVQSGSAAQLASAVVLTALAGLFKVQIVLVYGVVLLGVLLWQWIRWGRPAKAAAVAVLGAVYVLAIQLMSRLDGTPTLALSTQGALPNLKQALYSSPAHLSTALLPLFPDDVSYGRMLVLGVPLLLVATYGVWLVLLAVCQRFARDRAPMGSALLGLTYATLAAHLVVAFGLAPNAGKGDPFEIIHKTFVWPYFLLATTCCALAGAWLVEKLRGAFGRAFQFSGLALLVVLAAWVLRVGPTTQGSLAWSARATHVPVPRSLYEATQYLRTHTRPGSIVQFSANDPYLMVTALSERDSFVIQCGINCGAMKPVTGQRIDQLTRLLALPEAAQVRRQASALGIDWLLVEGKQRAWQAAPDARPDAVFGHFYIYATRPPGG